VIAANCGAAEGCEDATEIANPLSCPRVFSQIPGADERAGKLVAVDEFYAGEAGMGEVLPEFVEGISGARVG